MMSNAPRILSVPGGFHRMMVERLQAPYGRLPLKVQPENAGKPTYTDAADEHQAGWGGNEQADAREGSMERMIELRVNSKRAG